MNSSCIATNRGDYISLSYDNQTNSPVLYNSVGYNVQEVRIYSPSLHSYSGSKTDAELIAVHSSATGTKPLLVCLPIKASSSSSNSAKLFQQIVSTMASNSPADSESTEVNCDNYSLNNLIPKKPFFSYTATEPYQPCSTTVDYIVFSPSTYNLDIAPATLARLTNIISKNNYDIKQGPSLFYNEKGPGSGGAGGDEIYIDCQPVGSSNEQDTVVTDNGTATSFSPEDLFKSPFIQLIIAAIVFSIIIYGLKVIFSQKGGSNISITNIIPNKIK